MAASGDLAHPRAAGSFALIGPQAETIGEGAARVAFAAIEQAMLASPYVAGCIVSGAQRENLAALVMIDYDTVVRYAQARSTPFTHFKSLAAAADILALFEAEIARVNATIAPSKIATFTLADRPLAAGDPELGPALNLRRRIALQSFSVNGN